MLQLTARSAALGRLLTTAVNASEVLPARLGAGGDTVTLIATLDSATSCGREAYQRTRTPGVAPPAAVRLAKTRNVPVSRLTWLRSSTMRPKLPSPDTEVLAASKSSSASCTPITPGPKPGSMSLDDTSTWSGRFWKLTALLTTSGSTLGLAMMPVPALICVTMRLAPPSASTTAAVGCASEASLARVTLPSASCAVTTDFGASL